MPIRPTPWRSRLASYNVGYSSCNEKAELLPTKFSKPSFCIFSSGPQKVIVGGNCGRLFFG
jgi:hypothetical protein